jgi:hypothetical protein
LVEAHNLNTAPPEWFRRAVVPLHKSPVMAAAIPPSGCVFAEPAGSMHQPEWGGLRKGLEAKKSKTKAAKFPRLHPSGHDGHRSLAASCRTGATDVQAHLG